MKKFAFEMHADLYLTKSHIESNNLHVFQPVIINEKHVSIIGASKSHASSMRRSALSRYITTAVDDIRLQGVKSVAAAECIEIMTK